MPARPPSQFASLTRERERARELFDIDIERSIADWFDQLGHTPDGRRRRPIAPANELELDLTPREREVLSYTACGLAKEDVGELLGVKLETIRSHHKAICRKFRVRAIMHAAIIAFVVGELDVEILRRHLFRTWGGS